MASMRLVTINIELGSRRAILRCLGNALYSRAGAGISQIISLFLGH
jgi:hypothetical protein